MTSVNADSVARNPGAYEPQAAAPETVIPKREPLPHVLINMPAPRSTAQEFAVVAGGAAGVIVAVGALAALGAVSGAVVAVSAAAVTVAITSAAVARLFSRGNQEARAANQAVATLEATIAAVVAAGKHDREALKAVSDKLASDAAAFEQRVTKRAEEMVAETKATLEAEAGKAKAAFEAEAGKAKAALDKDREAFEHQTKTLELAKAARLKRLTTDVASLTPEQCATIIDAVSKYNNTSTDKQIFRIVGEVYRRKKGQPATPNWIETTLRPAHVLETLVRTGQVVAGRCSTADTYYVVQEYGATVITTVAELRRFLRMTTGANL